MDIADPPALPHADDGADGQADQDGGDGAHAHFAHKLGTHGTHQALGGAHGQVDVTAGEDTQQHAAGHDQNIGVLQQQVGQVLGIQHSAVSDHSKQDEDHHKGDDHGIFLQQRAGIDLFNAGLRGLGGRTFICFHTFRTSLQFIFCRISGSRP